MIYEILIKLKGTNPQIWRQVQVDASISLDKLHHIIQASMGWTNSHLYSFSIDDIEYSHPDFSDADFLYADSTKYKLKDFADERILYVYDYGDYWEHEVEIIRKLDRIEFLKAVCIDGKGKCPPEDVGGIHGFEEFLNIMADKNHPERESYIEWCGEEFDINDFSTGDANSNLQRI
jgi:hypothetical protein